VTLSRKKIDEYFMRRALSLALRGMERTSPNPLVGCVVERDGVVLAEGWHACCGEAHAERAALEGLDSAAGATIYVNLEPCSHFGRTPPCAPLIVEKGIRRAVVGMIDPDERVSGRGLALLRDAGLDVELGVLEPECRRLNRGFLRKVRLGRPWVTLKGAVGLDGSMALPSGESKWITSEGARAFAHLLRAEHDAVLVGAGTVRADDPELTVRNAWGRSPLRVLLDSTLSVGPGAKILGPSCIVFSSESVSPEQVAAVEASGASVVRVPRKEAGLSLEAVLSELVRRGVCRLLVEGGPAVISSFLREGVADALSLFLAPRLMGQGKTFTGGLSFSCMGETLSLRECGVKRAGEDFLLEGVLACSPDL